MFQKIIFLLFVIINFLISIELEAVEVKDLYQASVTINSQNSSDRANAIKKALAAVMIKVGGEKSVLENDVIKKSLKNYNAFLTQYRYQQKLLQITDEQGNNKQLFLVASFNAAKINQLFQEANLPLWGSLRPQVLLWLIDEQGLSRSIISNSSASNLPFIVNEFSSQRGLPIMMPLMDLTDTNQIQVSDVWGRFQQPIKKASERYNAEAIAVMRISNSSLVEQDLSFTDNENTKPTDCGLLCVQPQKINNGYVVDWSLLDWSVIEGQQKFSKQYQGADSHLLLSQALADITEQIYKRYALSTSSQNEFVIEVANVDSLAAYVDIFNFLNNLSSVKTVTLQSAKGSVRRFNLQLLGSTDALLASLKLNDKLTQYVDPLARFNVSVAEEATEKVVPIFYWSK